MSRPVRPPGPKSLPYVGSVQSLTGDPVSMFQDLSRNYGDIVFTWLGPTQLYMLNDPALIEELMLGRYRDCIKDWATRQLIPIVGNGLLTSEGDAWKRQRKLASPPLSPRRIGNYADTMVACTERAVAGFRDDEMRDVHKDLLRLTLEIVGKTLLGFDTGREADRVAGIVDVSMAYFEKQLWGPQGLLPPWMPFPNRRAFQAAVRDLDNLMAQMIARCRAQGEAADHLLARLAHARDDDGNAMDDAQLRDEAVTMLLAGHETTAQALTFAIYLLSENPQALARVQEELARELGGKRVTAADLPRLKYLDAVARETLRLYPPVYAIGRELINEISIGGYVVPKGAIALISPYTMHRDPRHFSDPDAFRPERWLEPRATPLPRFAYFPFGGGPRVCIGNHFATMEIALVLATVLEHVELTVVPGYELELEAIVTIRPARGMPVLVRRRRDRPRAGRSPFTQPPAAIDA